MNCVCCGGRCLCGWEQLLALLSWPSKLWLWERQGLSSSLLVPSFWKVVESFSFFKLWMDIKFCEVLFLFFFFFCLFVFSCCCSCCCYFLGCSRGIWRFPGWGSNRSCSCRPMPESQQCRIQAASATYTTAHGNAGSLTHWARAGTEPSTSWFLVGIVNHCATTGTPVLSFFNCVILTII